MNQKTEIALLMNKILTATMEMKDDFPEAYLHLNESPFFYSSEKKRT